MSAGASAPLAQAVAGVNRLVLSAQLVERGALRYTPAGLPAFDLGLKHESQVLEDGLPRRVSLEIRAVAIGEVTRRVGALELGNSGEFAGFLSAGRNGRGLLFHVTALD
ncbi:primosomal replication protein N [uncultured Azohydromonas sp.]|jgi:Primosomal replication protein N|uniref:primosomal replication protein N n=1 Tax=uncultured Azohydromonas sp. TaxID=487342 RepID=UPI00260BA06E|nr:primosomal replication protein N [uncultured Azohydromonas sp.]